MILTRTPFRVSFVGGGTDQPSYFSANGGGAVVSTGIDKFMYVSVKPCFDGRVRARYSKMEDVSSAEELEHDIIRACLQFVSIRKGIEIVTFSDIPSRGCGLGSSSALTVGLLNALYAFKGVKVDAQRLAEDACKVETEILNSPIGYQDQFASAYGGLSYFQFSRTVGTQRTDLRSVASYDRLKWLERASLLFYLGESRSANNILSSFRESMEDNRSWLKEQLRLVPEMITWLCEESSNGVEDLIRKSWEYKKKCSPKATNGSIEGVVQAISDAGVTGMKLCGAGGGGFLLVVTDPAKHHLVRSAVNGSGLVELDFEFEEEGSKVVYKD